MGNPDPVTQERTGFFIFMSCVDKKPSLSNKLNKVISTENLNALFERVVSILEQARSNVVRTVNSQMVIAYWMIGRAIVEEEQQGEPRAEYGKRLIEDLSFRLTKRYKKGFSSTNLRYFRQFYFTYTNRSPEIRHPAGGELPLNQKRHPAGGESAEGFHRADNR